MVALVALAMLVLVLSVVFGQSIGSDREGVKGSPAQDARGVAQEAASAPRTGASTSGADQSSATVAEMEQHCRLINLRQQVALGAAAVSLAQFQKHIDAMNLLVAGKISLDVATAFWDQTRIGAMEEISTFQKAEAEIGKASPACARLKVSLWEAVEPARASAITTCAEAMKSKATALKYAQIAVTTWEHHVHDMERLRQGEITPAEASALWKKSWKTGERQLRTFEAAVEDAASTRCALA
jgi:hypothetical protein